MLQEIATKFLKGQKEITRLKRIIERHEDKIEKIRDKWWGDEFIRPIMDAVKVKFPDLTWDDDRLVPMGLRNAVSVFAKDENGKTIMLRFTPEGLDCGFISIDVEPEFSTHGFGSVREVVEDIEQVYNHIQSQINLVD